MWAYVITLTDSEFLRNAALFGGGTYDNGAARGNAYGTVLNGGIFEDNTATEGGGAWAHALTLTGTQFLNNFAQSDGGGARSISGDARIVNAVFAGNSTLDSGGAVLSLSSVGNAVILHTTITSPTLASGVAILTGIGTTSVSNTIVASHTVGISVRANATATINGILWFANGADSGGAGSINTSNQYSSETVMRGYIQDAGLGAMEAVTGAFSTD